MANIVDVIPQKTPEPDEKSAPAVGDIFLLRRGGLVGWGIRMIEKHLYGTMGRFSHGGLIYEDGLIVDSTYEPFKINGVTLRTAKEAFKNSHVVVGRIWPRVTESDKERAWNRIVHPAIDKVKYDFKVLSSLGRAHRYNRLFCTELVWEYYKEAVRTHIEVPLYRSTCPTPDEIAFMIDPIAFSDGEARDLYSLAVNQKLFERGIV